MSKKKKLVVGDTVEIMPLNNILETFDINEDCDYVFKNVDVPLEWLKKLLELDEIVVSYVDEDGDFNVDGFEWVLGFGCTYPNEIVLASTNNKGSLK